MSTPPQAGNDRPSAGGIDAQLQVSYGDFNLEVSVQVPAGSVLAVLGPNGAGKTTLLRALAGLQGINSGHIRLGGRLVDNGRVHAPGEAAVFTPAPQRECGVVFQDYLLFPHLTVLENVAFGPRAHRQADPLGIARSALHRVGIADLATRQPAGLSGGQAQRVALARALANSPEVLLLDEPLAALDVQVRDEVRAELAKTLREFSGATVLVTHDPLDAFALADHVMVLQGGRVTQIGSPASLVQNPMTAYVAALTGVNLVHLPVQLPSGTWLQWSGPPQSTHAVIDPRQVRISAEPRQPASSQVNQWPGMVSGLFGQPDGLRVRVQGALDVMAWLSPAEIAALQPAVGMQVWVSVAANQVQAWVGASNEHLGLSVD